MYKQNGFFYFGCWLTLKMKLIIVFFVLISLSTSCKRTGDCYTTCYSNSTGVSLGTEGPLPDYTKAECEEKMKNRQTNLTTCNYEWEQY